MKIIGQLGVILAFGFAGSVFAHFIPVGIPASVWGLLLMLLALRLGVLQTKAIDNVSDFLGANMAFFFLPPAVSILHNYDALRPALLRLTVVCIISTLLTFLAAFYTTRLVRKMLHRKSR